MVEIIPATLTVLEADTPEFTIWLILVIVARLKLAVLFTSAVKNC